MQTFAGTCSPGKLHTLQKIFDLIWMELRASSMSNYRGPSDPDALRDEIARRVFNQYDGTEIDAHEMTRRVLGSFGVELHKEHLQSAVSEKLPRYRCGNETAH
jgi:hypothetical protein